MSVAVNGGGEPLTTWRGLDLSNVPPQSRLRCIVMLHAPESPITQEALNFLVGGRTISDLLDYDIATVDVPETIVDYGLDDFNRTNFNIDPELRALASGFVRQLLDEAASHRQNVPVGVYRMSPPDFPALDSRLTVSYTEIKMFVSPAGIRGTLEMLDNCVAPWFWSPEYTTVYEYGETIGWLLNVMLSGVWRDISVVRHKWRHVKATATSKQKRRNKPLKRKQRLAVMPRTVYHVDWADETDRRTIRARHAVRGFYRRLPDGYHTSTSAIETAQTEGFPPPPDGWTYVRAHQRGRGADAAADTGLPEIVCRGLQTVTLLMQLESGGRA